MSREFDSWKYSHSTKLDQKPQIFVNPSFRTLCGLKSSGLLSFDNMTIIHELKIG